MKMKMVYVDVTVIIVADRWPFVDIIAIRMNKQIFLSKGIPLESYQSNILQVNVRLVKLDHIHMKMKMKMKMKIKIKLNKINNLSLK